MAKMIMGQGITAPALYIVQFVEGILNKGVISIIILLIGFIIGRLAGKVVQKFLHELNLDQLFKKATGVNASLEEIAGYSVKYLIYIICIIMVLDQLGLASRILDMILATILIIIIIAIFLGIKDFIPNLIAGLSICRKGFISGGDVIEVNGIEGKIIKINLLETRIRTKKKDIISIPNVVISRNKVTKKNN